MPTNIETLFVFEKSLTTQNCAGALPMANLRQCEKEFKIAIDISLNTLSELSGVEIEQSKIKIIVLELYDQYKNDSFEDIIFCLRKIRRGEYGKLYGKIEYPFIAECMRKHLDEKYQIIEANLHSFKSGDNSVKRLNESEKLIELADRILK